jgi:hypothetical protein
MALVERAGGRSVAQVLEERAREHPDRVFLVFGDRRLTYRQLDARASAIAAALHELGIEPGDRIALDLPNWPEFVISMFAAAKLLEVLRDRAGSGEARVPDLGEFLRDPVDLSDKGRLLAKLASFGAMASTVPEGLPVRGSIAVSVLDSSLPAYSADMSQDGVTWNGSASTW